MARKKHQEEGHSNSDRWLLTYSDLITLLMIFFVIMYAMSNVDAKKYEQLSQSLNSALASEFGGGGGSAGDTSTAAASSDSAIDALTPDDTMNAVDPELMKAANEIQQLLQEKGLTGQVTVNVRERGVVISLTNTILFESGSAVIRAEGRNTLVQIGDIAKAVNHYIRVEGNTDDVPMNSVKFPSNWELSVIRATEVLKLLITESGVSPDKISAVGYGEYRPTLPNTSSENRAKNRKVDIVILSTTYVNSESIQDSN